MKPTFGCLILAVVLMASLNGQVEHAPTVAQCQADERVWHMRLKAHDTSSLKFYAVKDMGKEMLDCSDVDPDNERAYSYVAVGLTAEMNIRTMAFISRHNQWKQFIDEDAAGKR
jgi:hypothetical protein